jgi:hypothetical protein
MAISSCCTAVPMQLSGANNFSRSSAEHNRIAMGIVRILLPAIGFGCLVGIVYTQIPAVVKYQIHPEFA